MFVKNAKFRGGIKALGLQALRHFVHVHIATNTCLTDLNNGSCQACQFGWSFGIKNLAMCFEGEQKFEN